MWVLPFRFASLLQVHRCPFIRRSFKHFNSNAEDRYAHVPERHPLGYPSNSSGSGKGLIDIQLTDSVGGAMLAAKRGPHSD